MRALSPSRTSVSRASIVLRGITAAAVLLSADVHLVLYIVDNYASIPVVGPLFLLNAIAGFAIGVLLLVWFSWIPPFLAAGFGAATLAAFYLSATVGFFGVNEQQLGGSQQLLAAVSEWIALIGGIAVLVLERRSRTR